MTAYRQRRPAAELVHVAANLRADGGGVAAFGRLAGRALRRFAARHGLAWRGLHLAADDGGVALDGYDSWAGRRAALAWAVARLELAAPRRRALFFDHPGPARIQGHLPAWARARHAVTLHGVDAWRGLAGDRARGLARATFAVAVSRHTAERARPFLPEGLRVEVVHPGLEPVVPGGTPDRELLERVGSGFALIVGRLAAAERYKGHDELLAAWPRVRQRVPGARLVVAGDGDDRPRLAARAAELGLGEAVAFTGFVDAATRTALYERAALFVMPSREEGFGLVFLEAMAAGRACVARAGTAPAEIVVDGETGLLIPPGSPEACLAALAETIADLLARPEEARRLGEGGRRRFAAEFTFAAFERRFAPLLAELAGV